MSQSRALVTNPQQEQQQIQPAAAQHHSQFDEILAYLKRGEERSAKHDARLDALENQNVSAQAQMRSIETHMGQLAPTVQELKQQSLPSDTLINPKQVNAVTLRSGTQTKDSIGAELAKNQVKNPVESFTENEQDSNKKQDAESTSDKK